MEVVVEKEVVMVVVAAVTCALGTPSAAVLSDSIASGVNAL